MKNLILKNANNEIMRIFHCYTNTFCLIYQKRTGRLDLKSIDSISEQDRKHIKILREFKLGDFKNSKLNLIPGYHLELVDEIENGPLSEVVPQAQAKDFLLLASSLSGVFLTLIASFLIYEDGEDKNKNEKKPEQRIVKIIKPPTDIQPKRVIVNHQNSVVRKQAAQPIKRKKVKKVLKRMGALAALGSLSKNESSQKGGLNLGASVVSDGPGLRSLASNSKGSGGVQTALYNKGMITAALGSGGNIKGGGGYGTKGTASGGGSAGYGQLHLTGSGGSEDLSEATTMSLQGGGFDQGLIQRQILQRIGGIRNCYDQALLVKSDLKGVFVAQFFIGSKGKVVSSQIHKTSEVKSPQISNCILSIINKIKFDINLNKKEILNIKFPFDLTTLGA